VGLDMLQTWIVSLVVGMAALYCVWYVMPKGWRNRLGQWHRALGTAPGCGSCDSCGKCASPTQSAAPAPSDQAKSLRFQRKV